MNTWVWKRTALDRTSLYLTTHPQATEEWIKNNSQRISGLGAPYLWRSVFIIAFAINLLLLAKSKTKPHTDTFRKEKKIWKKLRKNQEKFTDQHYIKTNNMEKLFN